MEIRESIQSRISKLKLDQIRSHPILKDQDQDKHGNNSISKPIEMQKQLGLQHFEIRNGHKVDSPAEPEEVKSSNVKQYSIFNQIKPSVEPIKIIKPKPPRPPKPNFITSELQNIFLQNQITSKLQIKPQEIPSIIPKESAGAENNLFQNHKISKFNENSPIPSESEGCLECIDFSIPDAHASQFPRQNVQTIAVLAIDLTRPFTSKILKARAIFSWLHHNISYDTKSYFNNNLQNKTPEETLSSGLAVCQGYAELFAELALFAGLNALVVSGHGKGFGYSQNGASKFEKNHAWNAIQFDPPFGWHLIDSCWGAGYIESSSLQYVRSFKSTQFTSLPAEFGKKHHPVETNYQFIPNPISYSEYVNIPEGPEIFTGFTELGLSEATIKPGTRYISCEQETRFSVSTRCAHLWKNKETTPLLLLIVNGERTPLRVNKERNVWTLDFNTMDTHRKGTVFELAHVEKLGGVDAMGISVEEYLRSCGRLGLSWKTLVRWIVE